MVTRHFVLGLETKQRNSYQKYLTKPLQHIIVVVSHEETIVFLIHKRLFRRFLVTSVITAGQLLNPFKVHMFQNLFFTMQECISSALSFDTDLQSGLTQ